MNSNPDRTIDTVLTGLRNTPTPIGLEARVHARLLHAAESSTRKTLFASPLHLAWATTACAIILVLNVLATYHQPAPTVADLFSEAPATQAAPALPVPTTTRVAPRFIMGSPVLTTTRVASRFSVGSPVPTTTQVAPRFSVGSHRGSIKDEGVLTPDAIALAETLAPSHPAPPLPLTAQEALLLRSTRPGQPIELAELETRHASALSQIAEARERTTIREYIHGLLGPLATAETLTPSRSDDNKPVPDTDTPPSQ